MPIARIAILSLLLLACPACLSVGVSAPHASPLPRHYRDMKVYARSKPDPAEEGVILATLWLENQGPTPLDVEVTLPANASLGMAAVDWKTPITPGGQARITLALRPVEGLRRQVLRGTIAFAGVIDRDLFIAVQGPDPTDYQDENTDRITDRAQVVACYAPRTLESLRRSLREATADAPQRALVIAAKGRSDYQIVLPPSVSALDAGGKPMMFEAWAASPKLSPQTHEFIQAVRDLQRCIQLQSGATLPIVWNAKGPAIRLVQTVAHPATAPDRYTLATHVDHGVTNIEIRGDTLDAIGHGIYGLLTDHLDCHWFLPKKLGEEIVIPADQTVRLPVHLNETRSPSFFSATGMSWGQAHEWDLRNRSILNRGRMVFGHSWANYLNPREYPYDRFPDMWARDRGGAVMVFDKGWTSTNFCSTNPKVIEIVAARINAYFKSNPDAIVASLDPNDLAPLCQCDRCQALDRSYGVEHQDGEHMADRLLHFSKEIDDRLEPAFKDRYLGILAYGHQTHPPLSAKPHAHHAAIVCDFPSYFDHTRPFNDPTSRWNQTFHDDLRGWARTLHGGNMGFYDYYGQYAFFGPWGILHKLREDIPAFRQAGGTFLMIEAQPNFAINGPNLYIAARLAWDADADVDGLLEEYFEKYYGPAAAPMRAFWLGAERHFALTRPGSRAAQRVGRDPEYWREMDDCLTRAAKLAADAPKRFSDRIAFVRDGFDYGRGACEFEARFLPRHGQVADKAGATAYLREFMPRVERMRKTYSNDSDYWPIMMAPYFYPQFEPQIKALMDGDKTP